MKTNENIKTIHPLSPISKTAKFLGDGIFIFESNPDGNFKNFLIIQVMGSAIYDLGGDGSDVNFERIKIGGLARECFSEIVG